MCPLTPDLFKTSFAKCAQCRCVSAISIFSLLVKEGPKEDWLHQLGQPLEIKNLLAYLLTL